MEQHPLSTARMYAEKQFDIGVAVKLLRSGYRIYRSGWNGKGMYLILLAGHQSPVNEELSRLTEITQGTIVDFLPQIMMKTASVVTEFVPWSPSQADVLADDYRIDFS